MNIIFLDHFGVMCLANKHGRENKPFDLPRFDEMRIHGDFDNFEFNCINTLNSILDEETEIVVSSDWKIWCSFDRMCNFYLSQGIKKSPIDYTPSLYDKFTNIPYNEVREIEINSWLTEHPEINNWVAIDDLYLSKLKNFVWVSKTDEGINQLGIKDKLLSILNKK